MISLDRDMELGKMVREALARSNELHKEVDKELLQKSTISHLQIAKTLYQSSLQRNYNFESSSSNEKL
jgi:hypothetical protein